MREHFILCKLAVNHQFKKNLSQLQWVYQDFLILKLLANEQSLLLPSPILFEYADI